MSAAPGPPALQCVGIGKRFGDLPVVGGFDLHVPRGEICALLGPSGCGKTTALRLIAGFERLDRGRVVIGDRLVACAESGREVHLPPEQRRVGMVFQDYALFPHLSVRGNVGFGLPRGLRAAADAALALVGLQDLGERMPAHLSGGQQQRVALARALAPRPDVLLLDEPFSNLDASLRARVRAEVRDILREAGATAVLVTHDREEAFTVADRVAVMLDGRVAQIGCPEDVALRPRTRAISDFLGEAQYLPGTANGRTVRCALGTAPLYTPLYGPVTVVVPPEAVCLDRIGDDDGARGVVLHRQFLGHSFLLTVALDTGPTLTVRSGVHDAPETRQRVAVRLAGPVHALADPDASLDADDSRSGPNLRHPDANPQPTAPDTVALGAQVERPTRA